MGSAKVQYFWRRSAWSIAATLLTFACNGAKPMGLDIQKKKTTIGDGQAAAAGVSQGLDPSQILPEGSALLKTTYDIKASTAGLTLCRGTIELKVNANIIKKDSTGVFEFPTANLDCGILGKLDLTAMLGGFSTSAKPEMLVKDDVIHIKRLGRGWYDPSRPFLPSFLAGKASNLKSLNITQDFIVNDEAKKVSDRGTLTMRTLEFPATFKPKAMAKTFKKVLDFEIRITGFNSNIDKPMHMLFDSLRFRISLDPISILSIDFSGSVKALADSAKDNPALKNSSMGSLMGILPDANKPNATAIDKLLGGFTDLIMQVLKVNVALEIKAQDGVKDSAEPDEDDVFTDSEDEED
jgi:hypothetical protein